MWTRWQVTSGLFLEPLQTRHPLSRSQSVKHVHTYKIAQTVRCEFRLQLRRLGSTKYGMELWKYPHFLSGSVTFSSSDTDRFRHTTSSLVVTPPSYRSAHWLLGSWVGVILDRVSIGVCYAVVRTLCNPSWPQRTVHCVVAKLVPCSSKIQQRKLRTVRTLRVSHGRVSDEEHIPAAR